MKISIIIPIYNGAKYVQSALENIRVQTFPQKDIEVIIFLDGCTDNTAGIVKDYAYNHPYMNIKVIVSKKNVGVSRARNNAIAMATGDWLHFYDVDDILNTNFYNALYDAVSRSGADVAVASFYNEKEPSDNLVFEHENIFLMPQDKLKHTLVDLHGFSVRYLVRRKYWNENNFCFPEHMKCCEDLLIMNKMIYASNFIITVPGAIYTYKFRENSALTSTDNKQRHNRDYKKAILDVAQFLTGHGLIPNKREYKFCRYQLFGFFPILTSRANDSRMRIHYKLFGILLILSLRCRICTKKYV